MAAGWEPVRQAFEDNFRLREELGAAVVVLHRGRVVVDLWGGVADATTGRPWTRDTPAVCFSATKGVVAACYLLLADRGLDLDAPVAEFWPEFARNGKSRVTLRQLLNHRAGLHVVDAPLALRDLRDAPDRVHTALVDQRPLWEPDTAQAYAACTFGLYTGELFRRITGRTIGAFLSQDLAAPLGLQLALGRPDDLREAPARLVPNGLRTLLGRQIPSALTRDTTEGRIFRRVLLRSTETHRAFLNPSLGKARFESLNEPEIHRLELPWMNAIASAEALARLYAALAGDGSLDGVRLVRPASLRPLHGRQSWSDRDRVMCKPMGWSSGFLKDEPHLFSPSPRAFGHPGVGGALGWADPDRELAIGYVPNRLDWRIRSPRALALCHAAQAVVR